MSRPTLFDASVVERAVELVARGATNAQIAENIGVSATTIYEWKNKYPEFAEACKKGMAQLDEFVESALYQRARGYEHPAEKIFCNKDGIVTRVPYTERYPPDTGAAFIWLKNRQPDKWKDVRHYVPPPDPEQEDPIDLARRVAFALSRAAATTLEPNDKA
jgi:DNA-binding XRE family transcriptional regulator